MTNFNKEREEIIYELVLSLNKGDSYYAMQRVDLAIEQYNALVKNGIITEWCEHEWRLEDIEHNPTASVYEKKYKCSKCGETKITVYLDE